MAWWGKTREDLKQNAEREQWLLCPGTGRQLLISDGLSVAS